MTDGGFGSGAVKRTKSVDTAVITTSRLKLRPPRFADAPALFRAYMTESKVTKYLTWSPHDRVEETEAFIAGRIATWETGEACAWCICLHTHPEPIGMIELRPDGLGRSLGYVLGRRWWNCGVMSEALGAVVLYAKTALSLWTLSAWCDAENLASARVLEKNGFTLERRGPGPLPHAGFLNEIRPALFYVLLTPQ